MHNFNLEDLNDLKIAMGRKISPKQWNQSIQSGTHLPEEKEIFVDIYHILKKRIESLADKVSKPGEKFGDKIRDLNGKYSNLLDAQTVAEYDMLRAAKGPSLSYKDFILPSLLGVTTGSPIVAAAVYGGMYIVEAKTGRKLGQLASVATAKGLDRLAKTVEKVEGPKAIAVAKELRDLIVVPLAERSGRLIQILKNNQDITNIQLKDSKGTNEKYTKLGHITNQIVEMDKEQVLDLANSLRDKLGSDHIYIKNLERIAGLEDEEKRQRSLDALAKQPSFRELLQIPEEE